MAERAAETNPVVLVLAKVAAAVERRERAAAERRRTIAVVGGRAARRTDGVAIWIRRRPRSKLEELTELWHLEGRTASWVAAAGITFGACGSSLGDHVDRREDEPDSGDRCPACQGEYARMSQ